MGTLWGLFKCNNHAHTHVNPVRGTLNLRLTEICNYNEVTINVRGAVQRTGQPLFCLAWTNSLITLMKSSWPLITSSGAVGAERRVHGHFSQRWVEWGQCLGSFTTKQEAAWKQKEEQVLRIKRTWQSTSVSVSFYTITLSTPPSLVYLCEELT